MKSTSAFIDFFFQMSLKNRPFAQLLPGLETGHPVTVSQSPAYDFSVSDSRKLFLLSPFRTVLSAIHMQVTDRLSPDAPSLTQAIIVQMVYCSLSFHLRHTFSFGFTYSQSSDFPFLPFDIR